MDERTSRAKNLADRLIEEFYGGIAEKDWPMWATDAVTAMERYSAALSQPAAAQGDSFHSAGGECGGVTQPAADAMLVALRVTAGNIRSLGPAGAIREPYKIWLDVVESAIAKATNA